MTNTNSLIVKIKMGSHLYGCATPLSDIDYKEVRFQTLHNLLFDKKDTSKTDTRELDNTECQAFSLNYYMKMVMDGQVIALDMLFAPEQFIEYKTNTWDLIVSNRDKFTSKRIGPFVGYAKNQAIKYGRKGNKINTLDFAISMIEKQVSFNTLYSSLIGYEGIEVAIEKAAGQDIRHIVICGKSFGETTEYKFWLGPLKDLRKSFGKRAELCVDTGIDLKAQYHTIRICSEAIELLNTGKLTFPRPEASLLLDIRNGKLSVDDLSELVDITFEDVKRAEITSSLQETPEFDLATSIVYNEQAKYIVETI